MLDFPIRAFAYIRLRFFSIGYKKRIAIQLFVLLFIAASCIMLRPYFFANLADLKITQENQRNYSSARWDSWSANIQKRGYISIGDVYDGCDPNLPRSKVGKVLINFDKMLGTVVATVATNFTMPVSVSTGTVHVIAQYHGRTLFDQKFKLCKAKVDTFRCPLYESQDMRIYETFKLPKYIPKGRYNSYAKVSNQDGYCFVIAESTFRV